MARVSKEVAEGKAPTSGDESVGVPTINMARIILFTAQMNVMSRFYGEVLGLEQVSKEKGWQEFAAGGANIALHSGPPSPGKKGPKIVFYAKDVAALRETLVARGANFGKVRQGEMLRLCDGKDPDGNPIQLSDR
jgi:catechol 2,3-dioxygenase-like lactoylglutathione lyase family enzyme